MHVQRKVVEEEISWRQKEEEESSRNKKKTKRGGKNRIWDRRRKHFLVIQISV